MAQDPSTLKVEEKNLFIPLLEDVATALQEGLSSYFGTVSVNVVDCPNLTTPPYCLAAPGLCGSPQVVEVGGVSHFMPLYRPDKVYDLKHFPKMLGIEPAAFIGTGAGPFLNGHQCSELLANICLSKNGCNNLNRITKITNENNRGYVVDFLPKEETKFVLMANLFASKGEPGKVLKIFCKKRLKDDDFPAAVRKCLASKYKGQNIGLGGVFLVKGSKVRQHIPPLNFSSEPITTPKKLNNWLHFFDMNPPLIFVGTILTNDLNMEMILQHFHSFSEHGEGGHYHYDTNPESVEYLAYFNLAERALHVDRPPRTSDLSVDNITPTG